MKKPPPKFYNSGEMRKIVPIIDGELKKKIEKADIVSKDKKEGIKKQPKVSNLRTLFFFEIYNLFPCFVLGEERERR